MKSVASVPPCANSTSPGSSDRGFKWAAKFGQLLRLQGFEKNDVLEKRQHCGEMDGP